jgi:hypothetical protein
MIGVYLSSANWYDTLAESFVKSFRCDLFTDALTSAIEEL